MVNYDNYSLTAHNTFGIDARCDHFVELHSNEEVAAWAATFDASSPLLIIGGGSNLLLTHDFHGTVVRVAITGTEVAEEDAGNVLLRCGAGCCWDNVVRLSVDNGWSGMENLSAIPGDVGASAVQNIGAYGVDAGSLVHTVECVEIGTGRRMTFSGHDCRYAYRDSIFKHELRGKWLVTHVVYRLKKHFVPVVDYGNVNDWLSNEGIAVPTLRQMRDAIVAIRAAKLPDWHVLGNAGSFFKNPVIDGEAFHRLRAAYPDIRSFPLPDGRHKVPAGWLIERCGWKGRDMGRAGVFERQALILVNRGGATGRDVLALCNAVMDDVRRTFGIELQPEVNIV